MAHEILHGLACTTLSPYSYYSPHCYKGLLSISWTYHRLCTHYYFLTSSFPISFSSCSFQFKCPRKSFLNHSLKIGPLFLSNPTTLILYFSILSAIRNNAVHLTITVLLATLVSHMTLWAQWGRRRYPFHLSLCKQYPAQILWLVTTCWINEYHRKRWTMW